MSLSCSCDFDDDGDPDWYWWPPKEYHKYTERRGKRCCCGSCNTMIRIGDTCGLVSRTQPATEWQDERGLGDMDDPEANSIATHYMCERCTDLFFSFKDLGFECVSPYEDMIALAKQYHETYQKGETKND